MNFDIQIKNLSLQFGNFYALKDVSLALTDDKIYGLIGRNGAGKTSLLSLIASFREPSSGTLEISGQSPFENAPLMEHVNFIYDFDQSDEYENVKSIMQISERYRPTFSMEYAEQLIKKFKLPVDKPVKSLSKGMKSAMNVTIGLASRSPITIFDEAYLGMDAPTREIFYQELLEDQARHPRKIILSTHLVSEMEYLFDEVIIIDRGKLLCHESYDQFINRGSTVTGAASSVDSYVKGMKVLHEQQLGPTKSVMVYGELTDNLLRLAEISGLEISPVSLQNLFIHMTKEDE